MAGMVGLRPAVDCEVPPPAAAIVVRALVLDVGDAPTNRQQGPVLPHPNYVC